MSNACFLLGAYLLVCEKMPVQRIKKAFGDELLDKLYPFRDAGTLPCNYPLTVVDCLNGLKRAMELGWYSFERFNPSEFEKIL